MKKHIYKIAHTAIWTIIGLWLTLPVDDAEKPETCGWMAETY